MWTSGSSNNSRNNSPAIDEDLCGNDDQKCGRCAIRDGERNGWRRKSNFNIHDDERERL